MRNIMIKHDGALGDQGFTVPAIIELRKKFDQVYLFGSYQAVEALGATGLIDKFIVRPPEWSSWATKKRQSWLIDAIRDISFHASVNFNGAAVPGRYMYHLGDKNFDAPLWWKRKRVESANFFDVFSEKADTPQAMGKRPELNLSEHEKLWLQDFRENHKIPREAFLLGWQFTGSSFIKWYPFFDMVIQKGIMKKYRKVYVVGLGDMEHKIRWDSKYHGGRFINLGKSVSFRQAYILTSIFNCLVAPETGIMVFAQAWQHVPKILLATHTSGYHYTFAETKIIQSEAECSPCYNIVSHCKRDGDNPWSLCMGKIPPEKVIMAIEEIISNTNYNFHGN